MVFGRCGLRRCPQAWLILVNRLLAGEWLESLHILQPWMLVCSWCSFDSYDVDFFKATCEVEIGIIQTKIHCRRPLECLRCLMIFFIDQFIYLFMNWLDIYLLLRFIRIFSFLDYYSWDVPLISLRWFITWLITTRVLKVAIAAIFVPLYHLITNEFSLVLGVTSNPHPVLSFMWFDRWHFFNQACKAWILN